LFDFVYFIKILISGMVSGKKKIELARPCLKGLSLVKPFKNETFGFSKTGGRNNKGRITIKGRGFGHKRSFRKIKFNRLKSTFGKGLVCSISYDPFRSSYILLVQLNSGYKVYVLAPHLIECGKVIETSYSSDILIGNSLPVETVPLGSSIHNISSSMYSGGIFSRSAGTYSQLLKKFLDHALVRLSSKEQRLIPINSFVTMGCVSNPSHNTFLQQKAGRNRWLGFKSKVRGVAMNPVDHPHGGGEGKSSGGRFPVTPRGLLTRFRRTSKSKTSYLIIQSRRYKRRKK
jgi:large subunit ribosomal protein L2